MHPAFQIKKQSIIIQQRPQTVPKYLIHPDTAQVSTGSVVTTEASVTEPLAPYDFWKADEYRAKLTYDMDKFDPYDAICPIDHEKKNKIEYIALRCRKCGEFCNENMTYPQIVSSDIYSDEEIEKLNDDAHIISDMWELSSYCKTYDDRHPPKIYCYLHFPDECRDRYHLNLWIMTDKENAFSFADPDTLEEISIADILGEQWTDYIYSVDQDYEEMIDVRQASNEYIRDVFYFPDENVISATVEFYDNTGEKYKSATARIIVPGDKATQKYLVRS